MSSAAKKVTTPASNDTTAIQSAGFVKAVRQPGSSISTERLVAHSLRVDELWVDYRRQLIVATKGDAVEEYPFAASLGWSLA
jgi:hypothetical protein